MEEQKKELVTAGYSKDRAEELLTREAAYRKIMVITKYAEKHGAIEIYENRLAPEYKRYMLMTDRSGKVMFFSSLEAMSKWIEININAGGITLIDGLFYWG